MKRKIALFKTKGAQISRGLPSNIAASIGRTLTRHTYMESLQRDVINQLLEISIKQGRLVVRLPQPKQYPKLVLTLLQFHGLYPRVNFNFPGVAKALDEADKARNVLAHSLVLDDRKTRNEYALQMIRGSWEVDQDTFSVDRALRPERAVLNKAFLKEKRKAVDIGILAMQNLKALIRETMRALHEKRRARADWDRRRHRN